VFWLMLGVQGCVIIPATHKPIAGQEIKEAQLQFIQPGITTSAEVIKELGPPDWRFEDIRVLAYSWEVRESYVIGYPGWRQMVGQPYALLIELDGQDHVQRFETVKRGVHDTVRSAAVAWAKRHGNPSALALPSQFAPISVPSGKSVIHVYRPGGFEAPWVAIRVILDDQTLGDLRSKECLSVVAEPGPHSISLHPYALLSGKGDFDVRTVYRSVSLDAPTNGSIYIKLTVPAGRDRLEPKAKIIPENEAVPSLKKLKPL